MTGDSACPGCDVVIDPFPKRSRKCPHCRKPIVLRTDPKSKAKLLLSESEADEFDRAKKIRSELKRVLAKLETFGLGEKHYKRAEDRLTKEFGRLPSADDVFWRLANQHVTRLTKNPDKNAHEIQMCYWTMGTHLLAEGRSREEVQGLQRESNRWSLMDDQAQLQKYGLGKWTPIVETSSCCKTCGDLEGAEYTYAEALAKMPLPQAKCENDWCTCYWSKRHKEATAPKTRHPVTALHPPLVSSQKTRKNRTTAFLMTLFFGGIGGHHFYLGRVGLGVSYLLFSWTLIPFVISLVELFFVLDRTGRLNEVLWENKG